MSKIEGNKASYVGISKRVIQIKKNQKKIPMIDFSLKLDAYHGSANCLHCNKDAIN